MVFSTSLFPNFQHLTIYVQKFCLDSSTVYQLEEEGDILMVTDIIGEVSGSIEIIRMIVAGHEDDQIYASYFLSLDTFKMLTMALG